MSSIVGAITGGGGKGMGFSATSADLTKPFTNEELDQQYKGVQTGLSQQQDFLRAVQAQNGLANQSSVFNQQQAVANGTGPNPAQAMLANSTGANVANQAALMAGQRGSGANVGMMARQAANQGAAIQQNAAGQAAALQAQQSLGALNQMGGIATNQANQQGNATNAYTNAALQGQQNMLGAVGAYNNAMVGNQSNLNNVNGAMQGNIASQQGNMLGNVMGAAGSAAQMIPSMFSGGGSSAAGSTAMAGGAGESILDSGTMLAANGGMVPKYADGGDIGMSTPMQQSSGPMSAVGRSFMDSQDALGAAAPQTAAPLAPKMGSSSGGGGMLGGLGNLAGPALNYLSGAGDFIGNGLSSLGEGMGEFFGGMGAAASAAPGAFAGAGEAAVPVAEDAAMVAAEGGMVPALVSPGEKYLSPKDVQKVKAGAEPMKEGKTIPGKPKVGGAKNDYANDTISAKLEEGGIVLPRSVTQSKHPQWAAHKFVASILKEQAMKKGK